MSAKNIHTIEIRTSRINEILDITGEVRRVVCHSGVDAGICHVYVPHTTCGITINENADPDVKRDVIMALASLVPENLPYAHGEGNSTAHVKASLMGSSQCIFINEGDLVLGTWQGIYFCEFDGPRTRRVHIKVGEG